MRGVSSTAGNQNAARGKRRNPITHFAEDSEPMIAFPSHHSMDKWRTAVGRSRFPAAAAVIGDEVDFQELPEEMQTAEIAELYGAVATRPGSGFEACGSPNEVGNGHLALYPYIFEHQFNAQSIGAGLMTRELDYPMDRKEARAHVWTNVALKSADQLRQRMAWALSQIVIVAVGGVDQLRDSTEAWQHFYDIFVRHAFGNYRDVLKEASFSPAMTRYLTYYQVGLLVRAPRFRSAPIHAGTTCRPT